jgi:amino acid efflux transporter
MTELAKTLTALKGAALMLNIVIGAGLLALPGLVVQQAGSQAIWSWLLCAAAAVPLLLVFVIMGKNFPNAGGVAHFSKIAFGEPLYVVSSLLFLGAVVFGLPAIALTGGHYLAEVLPGHPALYAMLLIIAGSLTQLVSPAHAGKISAAISSIILLALVVIAGLGLFAVNWPGISTQTASISAVDLPTVFGPFMMIFFAFTGWEVAASLSEEFHNPKRDFPIAMALSFAAALVLYLVMAFIAQNTKIEGAHEAVFSSIMKTAFGAYAGIAMSGIAAVIIYANLMGAIWAVSRLVFSFSREGYLPLKLLPNAKGVPISAVLLTAFVLLLVVFCDWLGLLSISTMLHLAGQNFLILYGIIALSLVKISGVTSIRLMSACVAVFVLALLFFQGGTLVYPVSIVVMALCIGFFKKRAKNQEDPITKNN